MVRTVPLSLVGLGVLPLQFKEGTPAQTLKLDGTETYDIVGLGENGIGKRTDFGEYRIQSRGGKGIITMKTNDKTGHIVGALTVKVRNRVSEIREAGRNTQGVKLINLDGTDKLKAIAPVISEEKEEGEEVQEPPPAQ